MMKTARWMLALALVAASSAAHAQTAKWPEKPVRIIIAAAPGGGDDFVTRLIAPKLGELSASNSSPRTGRGSGA